MMKPNRNVDWDSVLSFRAAIEAHEQGQYDPDVIAFRARWFPHGLLPSRGEAVRRWLDEAAAAANGKTPAGLEDRARVLGEPARGPAVVIPPDGSPPSVNVEVGLWIPDAPVALADRLMSRRVVSPGALFELFWLGLNLSNRFGWDSSYARGWTICEGALPVVHAILVRSGSTLEPQTPHADRHRVLLDVSLDAPPARVDQELRALQAAQKASGRESSVPARPIAEWNLRATLFAIERNDGRAWEDVLCEWNEKVPDPSWRYREGVRGAQLLGNTVHRTYSALTGKPLDWKRKAGQRRSK